MVIYIDGADAVGKSTLAEKLANWIKCDYVDLPIESLINDYAVSENKFSVLKQTIRIFYAKHASDYEKAWFNAMGLIHLAEKYTDKNAVSIRSLISSSMFNRTKDTEPIYEFLASQNIGTSYCIVLDASDETRFERMERRGKDEEEIKKGKVIHYDLKSAIEFGKKLGCKILYIDTNNLNQDEVFENAKQAILKNEYLCKKLNLEYKN